MILTIKRSEWLRGASKAPHWGKDTGKGDVVGHYLRAVGFTPDELDGVRSVEALDRERVPAWMLVTGYNEQSSDLIGIVMVNDDKTFGARVREQLLIEALKKQGVELKFVD